MTEADRRTRKAEALRAMVMPIEMRGSQLVGRSLVTRQRGQWHSMWVTIGCELLRFKGCGGRASCRVSQCSLESNKQTLLL